MVKSPPKKKLKTKIRKVIWKLRIEIQKIKDKIEKLNIASVLKIWQEVSVQIFFDQTDQNIGTFDVFSHKLTKEHVMYGLHGQYHVFFFQPSDLKYENKTCYVNFLEILIH